MPQDTPGYPYPYPHLGSLHPGCCRWQSQRFILHLLSVCFLFYFLIFFLYVFLFEEWKLCFVCVCCSSGLLPCPSCSSLRSCRTIFSYLFFYCIPLVVLFTLAQSTVAVVGSCFSCAYLFIYIYI